MTIATDELSAEELAYLDSGGKVTDGLPISESPPAPEPSDHGGPQEPAAGLPAPQAGQGGAAGDDDEDDDGSALPEGVQIKVDKNGRPRLVDAQGKFVKSVPHKAFHSERERRKAIAKENESLKIQLARGEERLAILNEAFNGSGDPKTTAQSQQPANPLDEDPIDIEKDFVGWAKQMQRQKDFLVQQLNTQKQTTEDRESFRSMKDIYHADAKALLTADPQFEDAYRHLVGGRHRELEFMGMTDEKQRSAYIAQEESALVAQAIQQGKRPAQVIYEMAKARGFVGKNQPIAGQQQNEQHPQLSAAQQKIAAVKNGQTAAQTLSTAGSGSSEGLTFASLASMSDEEFARAVDGMSKAQIERFLGR